MIEERYEEAEEEFKKCVEIEKDKRAYGRLELGKLYVRKGRKCEIQKRHEVAELQYEKAEKELQKVKEREGNKSTRGRKRLGELYAIQGKYEEAEREYKECIQIEKNKRLYNEKREENLIVFMFKSFLGAGQNKKNTLNSLSNIFGIKQKEIIEITREYLIREKKFTIAEDGSISAVRGKMERITNINSCKAQAHSRELRESEKRLNEIRAKIIRMDTLEIEDIEKIKKEMQVLERRQYYLIQIAIYEKLKQKSNALNVIKQMEEKGIEVKGLGEIKQRLKSKKITLFDLGKWDEIIGWSTVETQVYEEEREKLEKEEVEQEPKKKKQEEQVDVALETEKEKSLPKEKQKPNHIRTNIDSVRTNENGMDSRKKRKIGKKKIREKEEKTETIFSKMSQTLKTTIEKVNCYYYVNMQPQEVKRENEEEYRQLLQEIKQANVEDKKRLMGQMRGFLQPDYEEKARQEKYIKKYDKLQSLLESSKDNKRAQMELMLVLINEGYREVVKKEFPKEDYSVIDETIKQYYAKTIAPKVAKQKIDDYAKTTKQEGISIE